MSLGTGVKVNVDSTGARKKLKRLKGGLNARTMLNVLGLRFLRWVDVNFREEGTERKWRRLSPNTIAGRRQGSSRILQDTGRMKQSFIQRILTNEVHVGTQNQIAAFHHHGTSPYVITPKNKKMLVFKVAGGMVFTRKVNHPGLPARPLLPTKFVADKIAAETIRKIVDRAILMAK